MMQSCASATKLGGLRETGINTMACFGNRHLRSSSDTYDALTVTLPRACLISVLRRQAGNWIGASPHGNSSCRNPAWERQRNTTDTCINWISQPRKPAPKWAALTPP